VLRKLFAFMIFGGLEKIRGAFWVVVQLLTFWNSFKRARMALMMTLPTYGEIKRWERRRALNWTIGPRYLASAGSPLSLGRDLVPFSPAASHRFI